MQARQTVKRAARPLIDLRSFRLPTAAATAATVAETSGSNSGNGTGEGDLVKRRMLYGRANEVEKLCCSSTYHHQLGGAGESGAIVAGGDGGGEQFCSTRRGLNREIAEKEILHFLLIKNPRNHRHLM